MKKSELYVVIVSASLCFCLCLGLLTSCFEVDQGGGVGGFDDVVLVGDPALVKVSFRVADHGLNGGAVGFGSAWVGGRANDQVQSYSIDNPGVNTDEGTSAGYLPKDVWVVQYDGIGDDAVLSGQPRYVEILGVVDIQAVVSAVENTLVFVANTHDSALEFGDIGTLGKMKRACREIEQESDCFGNNYSSYNDLIFSGMYKGLVNNSALSVELFRNIARLDFTLQNAMASSMTLHSIQLCNVSRDLYYACGTVPTDVLFPTKINYFDYPAQVLTLASNPGGVESFVFYMPANQRGVVAASTSSKTKPDYAPSYSTHIKIMATNSQNQAYVYKIYPGANIVNDYNISPNNRYTFSLAINAPGDASADGRVENYADIDFASANSYILNPEPVGSKSRIFTIPIDRLNEFWKDQDPTLTIGPTDAWTVELIWQDTSTPDFISFIDLNTGLVTVNAGGIGPTQRLAFRARSGSEGNALIGLKKVGRESVGYLWSWHLWVTPYNPTYEAIAIDKQYVYSVPGGAVHRYQGAQWTAQTGRYRMKYMMDRNLGARDDGFATLGALYYQFGRKDPLPANHGNKFYDIKGVPLEDTDPRNPSMMNKDAGRGVTLATGVLNPTFFYYKQASTGYGDWSVEGREGNYAWNNPVEGPDLKSIFDPCPLGWKLPLPDVWSDFLFHADTPSLSTALDVNRDISLGWNYGVTGMRYWPVSHEVAGSIFYPALGLRNVSGGGASGAWASGFMWSALPGVTGRGVQLSFASTRVWLEHNVRVYGFQVRCVQE